MSKKTAENEFEKMLKNLLQEHYKQQLSRSITHGMKQAKRKKSQKHP